MKKAIHYFSIFIIIIPLISCKKPDEVTKKDELIGTWDMTDYTFKIYEAGIETQSYTSSSANQYLGELTFKEEKLYESDVINQMKEAYFLYGYSDNAIVDGFGSRGIWQRVNDEKLQFDKGIPDILTEIEGEGHIIDFEIKDNVLEFNAINNEQFRYYGYYNGKFSNTPSSFSPSASVAINAALAQSADYDIGYYFGYFIGYYEGQVDKLKTLGGDDTEAYWYGLLLGSLNTMNAYYAPYENNAQAVSGFNTAYSPRYQAGVVFADSLYTSPAKSYLLNYKFKRQ